MTLVELDYYLRTKAAYANDFIHIATGFKGKIYGTGGGSTLKDSRTKLIGYILTNGDKQAIPCDDFIKRFRFFDNNEDGLKVSKARSILSRR